MIYFVGNNFGRRFVGCNLAGCNFVGYSFVAHNSAGHNSVEECNLAASRNFA